MTNPTIAVTIAVTDLDPSDPKLQARATRSLEEALTARFITSCTKQDLRQALSMNIQKLDTPLKIIDLYLEQGATIGLGKLHVAWKTREQYPELWQHLLQHVTKHGMNFTDREAGVYDAVDPDFIKAVTEAIAYTGKPRMQQS